jgi:hypothetical protein
MSLAMHLAFWAGRDCERIKRLMAKSALVRDKWEREEYVQDTISRACDTVTAVLQDKLPEPIGAPSSAPKLVEGDTYVSIAQQFELFKGCTYIQDEHRILLPSGATVGPDQFKVAYGGYQFIMDNANGKVEQDAWKCFTQSRAVRFPRSDTTCFRPDLDAGHVSDVEGFSAVNLYVPLKVPKTKGDVSLFLNHVKKLLPDERDAAILISYMAACVQHVGLKFQWAPVIQGVEGNGKSILMHVVAEAVGRKYSHFPPAAIIGEKYNDWLYKNVFVGVNDIYIPEDNIDLIEVLKPMITESFIAVRAMGTKQTMRQVCANFMFNMNPVDGMKKTRNDRRYCPLYCAQQNESDLKRDGLTSEYFNRLQTWLKKEGGYAATSEFLSSYPIPAEFGIACLLSRAPVTSSTETAIQASLGRVELEILERIEAGAVGFSGGWVSSHYLDLLISELRAESRYPRTKRRAIMQALGYDWHVGLPNGRTYNPVQPDGAKSVLYAKREHIINGIQSVTEITKAYSAAQMPSYSVSSNTTVFK